MKYQLLLMLPFILLSLGTVAQDSPNYDEDAIAPYVLPALLKQNNGAQVETIEQWEEKRRPEIIKLFEKQVYGEIPDIDLSPSAIEVVEESEIALDNTAIRKQIGISYNRNGRQLKINVLLYIPKEVEEAPLFVGYNFYGNHTTISDPAVVLTDAWVRNNEEFGIIDNKANDASRGKRSYRWPIQKIINEGFGVALIYYGDVDPDRDDFSDGVHALMYKNGQDRPKDDEWGAISAWSWGLSQVLDVLEKDELTKTSPYIAFGHSRLGKTSLWAGAMDERFELVISNDSGCGGAALFRRKYGETAAVINKRFPHWFNTNFKKYSGSEETLPIDQHMLIALMAPRPVYIASAQEDRWADPKGEYLSGYHASPIYQLYGFEGLESDTPPSIHEPIHNNIGYHIRSGKHDVTNYDWEQYIKFARKHILE